ncbi:RES domain-containing protein [Vibrio penaeicida]|uniref:RES domain-containing protein n=1 Tax=Vibrio penaeicida TaxID=104609 RepID=UPI001CC6F7BC|nr:RES domain-containing protein [Vibrio penaeicida]
MNNTPPLLTIESGRHFYRALRKSFDDRGNRNYTAIDPNPFLYVEFLTDVRATFQNGATVEGRFSPFRSNGKAVPALYIAPTKETAYFETVLRPQATRANKTLSAKEFDDLAVATISFEESLTLADCRSAYLKGGLESFWDMTFDDLFNKSQMKCMDNARTLAKQIYETYPDVDGLVWDSVQQGNIVPVYLLFGPKREATIHLEIDAWEDIPTWKPYLYQAVSQQTLSVDKDLAAKL